MTGSGRILGFAKAGRSMGAGRLGGGAKDREDGQPAFLDPICDGAAATEEEDPEQRKPEQPWPNPVRQEA